MNWKQVDKLEFTDKELEIINFYCENEMRELKKYCRNLFLLKSGVDEKYYDDVYSEALIVLIESIKDFNGEKAKFNTFLSGNLRRSFSTWYRDNFYRTTRSHLLLDDKGKIVQVEDKNGKKKPVYLKVLSLDYPTEDGGEFKDVIPGETDVKVKEDDFEYSSEMKEYLSRLSKLQRKILDYLTKGYSQEEIQEILHISSSLYRDNLKNIMDEKNLKIIRVLIGGR